MATIFEQINRTYDTTPIVLIDESGSTSSPFQQNVNVFNKENAVIRKILEDNHIETFYLAYWNNNVHIVSQTPVSYDALKSAANGGGTQLEIVLERIPDTWYGRDVIDIYIVTDGEINGDMNRSRTGLQNVINDKKANVHIITVEPNNRNYLAENCGAGNAIFSLIKSSSLTNKIYEFLCFNRTHNDVPFINFQNVHVPTGHFPFGECVVKKEYFTRFVEHLASVDYSKKTKEENLKTIYNLSFSLCHLGDASTKKYYAEIFESVLKSSGIENIASMLHKEMTNAMNGQSNTFQSYRNERTNKLEQTQIMLFENVADSICKQSNSNMMTLPIRQRDKLVIITSNKKSVSHTVNIGMKQYKQGGININNHNYPCIPLDITLDNGMTDECLRKWISMNYIYNYSKYGNEAVIYLILTEILLIILGNAPENIKASYIKLVEILLKEKFNEKTILQSFMEGNPPTLSYGNSHIMNGVLQKCMRTANITNTKSNTFLFGLFCLLGDNNLLIAQLNNCKEDLSADNLFNDNQDIGEIVNNVLEHIGRNTVIPQVEIHNLSSLANTHNVCVGIVCPYQAAGVCPICNNVCESQTEQTNANINIEPNYKYRAEREIVNIGERMYTDPNDYVIASLNELDFKTGPYVFDKPCLMDTLNAKTLTITNVDEFKNMANMRYPFLRNLDMSNVCLAGGFCRSILLKSKMKDFDFFFYGQEDPFPSFARILKQLTENMMALYKNIKFFMMYKPLYNVFEVICVNDPKDFIKDGFSLDYFDKFKFNSLNIYNKGTIIDPKKKEVVTNDEEFEKSKDELTTDILLNYFEDNDKSGVSMKHRIQFVLCKFNTVHDILNNFDLPASRVAYTGNDVLFTESSYFAYKYMVNVVNETVCSSQFDNRISKYFSYGFSMVFPELDITKVNNQLAINEIKCDVYKVENNTIITLHDSNLKEKMISNNKIVERNKREKVELYKSALFASLVGVCRYVNVNDIAYSFVNTAIDLQTPDVSFSKRTENVHFVDKIVARYMNFDLYKNMRVGGQKPASIKPDIFTNIKHGEIYLINTSTDARQICLVKRNELYDSFEFTGNSAKKVAQLYVDTNDKHKIITQIMDNVQYNGKYKRRFVPFVSWDDCYEKHRNIDYNQRYVYEIIESSKPCKPYLDIEWNGDDNGFLDTLCTDIIDMFRIRYGYNIGREHILITSASSGTKVSYHVVIHYMHNGKQLVFATNKKNGINSAYDLYSGLTTLKPALYMERIDGLVYTEGREFRTIYSNKDPSCSRPFMPLSGERDVENFKDYLVTYYTNDVQVIETPLINYPFIPNRYRKSRFVLRMGPIMQELINKRKA